MDYQTITLEITDGLGVLTLNRPDKMNALTSQMRAEIDYAMRATAKEARDIFSARRAIERAIVESITPAIMRKQRQRIATHMNNERKATNDTDRRAIVRELSEFHLMLGAICGNTVLSEILGNLMVRSSLIVALYQRNDVPSCASDEHQQIITALEAGDHEKAVAVMIEHLDELEGQLALESAAPAEFNLKQALKD